MALFLVVASVIILYGGNAIGGDTNKPPKKNRNSKIRKIMAMPISTVISASCAVIFLIILTLRIYTDVIKNSVVPFILSK